MKPSEELTLCRSENLLWWFLNEFVVDAFKDFDITKEKNKQLYVHVPCSLESFPEEFQEDIKKLQDSGCLVGENEKDLLSFITFKNVKKNLFFLGRFGSGKTTCINHFINNILPELKSLNNLKTILIDFTKHRELLEDFPGELNECIMADIMYYYEKQFQFGPIFSNEFWEFLGDKHTYYIVYKDKIVRYGFFERLTNEEKQRFAEEQNFSFIKKYPIQSLSYELEFRASKENLNFLIIFDNIDILPGDLPSKVLKLSKTLTAANLEPEGNSRNIKCIVALRTESPYTSKHRDSLDIRTNLHTTSIRLILKKRWDHFGESALPKLIREKRNEETIQGHPEPKLIKDGKVFLVDTAKIHMMFECLQRTVLSDDAIRLLESLSGSSIRRCFDLTCRLLSSSEIPDPILNYSLFDLYIKETLPLHILKRAIVLGGWNYYTSEEQNDDLIANIYIYRTVPHLTQHQLHR